MRRRASISASRSGVSRARLSRISQNVWSFHQPLARYFWMSSSRGGRGTSIMMPSLLLINRLPYGAQQSAVGLDRRARDVAALRRDQQCNQVCDVVGRADPLHRNLIDETRLDDIGAFAAGRKDF